MSNTDRIQQLLAQRPGLKAQQIANELGLGRSYVAAALHGLVGAEVVQDSTYRWWPKTLDQRPAAGAAPPPPRTFRENLCRYYLECLSRESGSGISIPAAAFDTDYVVLNELPFAVSLTTPAARRNDSSAKYGRSRDNSHSTLATRFAFKRCVSETKRRCESSRCCSIQLKKRPSIRRSCCSRQRHPALQSRSPEEPSFSR